MGGLPAQLGDVRRTVGGDQHAAVLLQSSADLQRPAEQQGGDLRHLQVVAGKADAAVDLAQRRQGRIDGHFVVRETIDARHLRFLEFGLVERDGQVDVQAPVARGLHTLCEVVDLFGHRAPVDEFQELGGRAVGLSLDEEGRHRGIEVGDAHMRIREARA